MAAFAPLLGRQRGGPSLVILARFCPDLLSAMNVAPLIEGELSKRRWFWETWTPRKFVLLKNGLLLSCKPIRGPATSCKLKVKPYSAVAADVGMGPPWT
eukprot:scaffold90_cov264-Pinguiococcus_pyrenoidosus.AAC.6